MELEQKLWQFLRPENWWFRHFLFWLYRYSDRIIYFIKPVDPTDRPEIWHFLSTYLLPDLVLVYINLLILIPYFLLKKRIGTYIITAFGLILAYGLITYWSEPVAYKGAHSTILNFYLYDFMDGVEMLGLSAGLRLLTEYLYQYQRRKSLTEETLRTEVAYLKYQISPHFLFNALNNIAVIAEKYPDRIVSSILNLSNVLRYQLYEGEKEQVFLDKEIENLRQILQIEGLRLNDPSVTLDTSVGQEGIKVAPFIFLPFVENAIKHSANPYGKSVIKIRFWIEGNLVLFSCVNSKSNLKGEKLSRGIGLENVRRRLELLYPASHELKIEDTNEFFTVNLSLKTL